MRCTHSKLVTICLLKHIRGVALWPSMVFWLLSRMTVSDRFTAQTTEELTVCPVCRHWKSARVQISRQQGWKYQVATQFPLLAPRRKCLSAVDELCFTFRALLVSYARRNKVMFCITVKKLHIVSVWYFSCKIGIIHRKVVCGNVYDFNLGIQKQKFC